MVMVSSAAAKMSGGKCGECGGGGVRGRERERECKNAILIYLYINVAPLLWGQNNELTNIKK